MPLRCLSRIAVSVGFRTGRTLPREDRPLERGPFLAATWTIFCKYLLYGLHGVLYEAYPRGQLPLVGHIPSFAPVQRYVVSTLSPSCWDDARVRIRTVYALVTLIGRILRPSPLLWPPFLTIRHLRS